MTEARHHTDARVCRESLLPEFYMMNKSTPADKKRKQIFPGYLLNSSLLTACKTVFTLFLSQVKSSKSLPVVFIAMLTDVSARPNEKVKGSSFSFGDQNAESVRNLTFWYKNTFIFIVS